MTPSYHGLLHSQEGFLPHDSSFPFNLAWKIVQNLAKLLGTVLGDALQLRFPLKNLCLILNQNYLIATYQLGGHFLEVKTSWGIAVIYE